MIWRLSPLPDKNKPAQVGLAQVGPAQVGPSQVGPAQVGPAQVGLAQVGLAPTFFVVQEQSVLRKNFV